MRYIIAGSVAFALVAGIALGFVLRGGAFEAEAKPVLQQREDQIVLTASRIDFVAGEFWQKPSAAYNPIVALDPAEYPAGTEFNYEAVLAIESADTTGCTRLYNLTTDLPVVGSEICLAVTTTPARERVRSGPIDLTSGENEYTIESVCRQPACGVSWHGTRIIAEWTEKARP